MPTNPPEKTEEHPDVANYRAYEEKHGWRQEAAHPVGNGDGDGYAYPEDPDGSRLGAVVIVLVVAAALAALFLGGRWLLSEPGASVDPPAQGPDAPVVGDALGEGAGGPGGEAGRIADTGVAFEPVEGESALRAGIYEWDGEFTVEKNGTEDAEDDTEILVLDGPTFANLKTGFKTGDSEVTSGNFGFATLNYRVHAEYHRTVVGEPGEPGSREVVYGSYFAFDDETLLASGRFEDVRTGDGDEVVRTYAERDGGTGEAKEFRVKFEAAPLTPAVMLVGSRWEAPQGS